MATPSTTQKITSYIVGGAVRDKLLKRPVTDVDHVVVGATVEQMLSLGFTAVGKDFPVFLHPTTKEEYALARTEKKQGVGYKGFQCDASASITLEQDLFRRDLSINAMAMDDDGNIIDPYNGLDDLKNRKLRHVSNAFIEDPLRVLRIARFAARYVDLGFSVAPETFTLLKTMSKSGELQSLNGERIWKEINSNLGEDNPEVFFQLLYDCCALHEIWPSLANLWEVPNPPKWHPEICSGIHTLMVLKQATSFSQKKTIRFAALCHDLGKSVTPQNNWPSHHGHETTGLALIEEVCVKFKIPNNFKSLALKVCRYHLHCHKAFELKADTLLSMFNQLDVWRKPEEFSDFLVACKADFTGRLGFEDKAYPQLTFLQSMVDDASNISAKKFVEQGLKGKEIKVAMDQQKLEVITAHLVRAKSVNLQN